jgi:hypothetical protein
MSFQAQGTFLDDFIRALELTEVHIVGPDVGMPAALHCVIHHEHAARSLTDSSRGTTSHGGGPDEDTIA